MKNENVISSSCATYVNCEDLHELYFFLWFRCARHSFRQWEKCIVMVMVYMYIPRVATKHYCVIWGYYSPSVISLVLFGGVCLEICTILNCSELQRLSYEHCPMYVSYMQIDILLLVYLQHAIKKDCR